MINFLRGTLASIEKESIVLDVSGFGVEIYPTRALLASAALGEEMKCLAYMQISDAGLSMFGFASQEEKDFFLELLQVKTVGGKLAIALMRYRDLGSIIDAIRNGNVSTLSVPGLGAKRAERICFELKAKIEKKFVGLSAVGISAGASFDSSVTDALSGLGFSHGECARAIAMAKAQAEDDVKWSEESLLKASLGILQRR
ncbi:MAG: Holliday junction branch migration protein RuvA [Synergistes jonesii]|uniref:Holliday junction branch migration protein RuvA n=1 Tax=Synergistes jonesii TaxID=2754 RepID=UPI002A752D53|nr:Holliday junction branch migration protein RuvA [Synergistes jonesii]MDY2984017.1 Holliday junction branch migration protein RuvA [Synergistes jonesii]